MTYTLIDSVTLASSASSVTFSSIDQSYRDLVLVCGNVNASSANQNFVFYLNGDYYPSTAYSEVFMEGNGSVTDSDSAAGGYFIRFTTSTNRLQTDSNAILAIQLFDYTQTDKHKTALVNRSDSYATMRLAGRWANTSAITSITVDGNVAAGATYHLYGISA